MFIQNQLNITYNAIMPNGNRFSETARSNTVTTEILSYSVSKTIRSEKKIVRTGETVRHIVTVTNRSAAKLFETFFSASQPNDARYAAGSVKINKVAQPTYDPLTGFALPDLEPGETVVIEYEIKADQPTTAPVTHFAALQYTVNDPVRGNVTYSEKTEAVAFNVLADTVGIVKKVDKALAVKGDTLHYTVTVTNTGNVTKTDLVFKDPVPDGTAFVPNSVKVDGTAYSAYHPARGFVLRSLAPNETITVEFDVKVI